MPDYEEIVVEGRRVAPGPPSRAYFNTRGGGGGGGGPYRDWFPGAFVAPSLPPALVPPTVTPPPVAPTPIPEITVTGKAPVRPPFGAFGTAVPRAFSLGYIGALVGGYLARAIFEERGQAMLDAEYEKLMAKGDRVQTDSPVFSTPEAIPEIVVTAKRAPAINRYLMPPLPQFYPDFATPYELSPAVSPRVPMPDVAPQTDVSPLSIPLPQPLSVPSPAPFTTMQPTTSPWLSPQPFAQPQAQPRTDPRTQPQTRPQTRPGTRPGTRTTPRTGTNPLTRLQPRGLPYPQPMPMPQPKAEQGRCPPCKKKTQERKKPRTACWKKLVKEGPYEEDDESYNWVRINCMTKQELN